MKGLLFFMSALLFLASCDSGQKARVIDNTPVSSSSASNSSTNNPGSNFSNPDDNNAGNDSDPNTTTDPGFEKCDLKYQYYAKNLGYFGACQNTIEPSKLKIKFQKADSMDPNCVIPMRKEANGTSYSLYKGVNVDCLQSTVAETNYIVTVRKDQLIDQNIPINAFMFLKLGNSSPTGTRNMFYACMYAKSKYMNEHLPCTSTNCLQAASNYAQMVCNDFASIHADNYKQVAF